MTDFKELREALEAGPEPISTELLGDRYFSGDYSTASLTKEQDALIAAANPATIRSLLAELDEARRDADIAIGMLAEWCVAVDVNGTGWDDWDEHYKNAAYRPGPLRERLDAAIDAMKEQQP